MWKLYRCLASKRLCSARLDESGSITLFALMMTLTILGLFGALVTYGMNQMKHADTLRTLEMTGQSILHTYDRRLLESYSLLAVDLEVADPQVYMNASSRLGFWWKGQRRSWQFEPRQTLNEPEAFLEAVARSVASGTAEEALSGFSSWMEKSPGLSGGQEPAAGASKEDQAFEKALSGESSGTVSEEEKDLAIEAVRWIREMGRSEDQVGRDGKEVGGEAEEAIGPELTPAQKDRLPSQLYEGLRRPLEAPERLAFVYYVARHFRDRAADNRTPFYKHAPAETFFNAEREYLLYGHGAEVFNEARAYADVFLLRLAGNTAHVAGCQKKQKWIAVVSGAVNTVFGVPAVMTSSALVVTWAAAESRSDLKRLLAGEELPWIHGTDAKWQTQFGSGRGDTVLAEEGKTGPVNNSNASEGFIDADYGDHLSALLWMKAGTAHVLRAMDLIALGSGENKGGLNGIDLSQRATAFSIQVEALGSLPAVTWEDGYGWE
ncbi:DUF5702 domain-containing protein [Acidaminobacter hydrogenoformans]|uniref:Uncharacterized protein n=1 Tax=Acidaminobacter hydrogenoformans DSM 2784 TaxID=1120920 RepID=A0A1G5S338_9FIRM|nr:DUF5702 domain-containing protein [Acidaminobacter hydrogenoformans]SCZ80726.1 hypothetical protein SAMN03080599_02413 [Acidaminobacter hydrogenoformans DSM 2784]